MPTGGRGLARLLLGLIPVLAAVLAGCLAREKQITAPAALRAAFVDLAVAGGFIVNDLDTGGFQLASALRTDGATDRLVVYIEGDGRAWLDRTTLAPDPTPTTPMVMGLAVHDTAPDVAYLARPCQYLGAEPDPACTPEFWSSHRFADAVIEATDRAIDQLVSSAGAPEIVLVGYSGGAAVAALVAVRRRDVVALITVAGIFDHAAWTRHHGVSPLDGSRNPIDVAAHLADIPQLHLFGGDDPIVPRHIVDGFVARLPAATPVDIVVLPGYDHDCCWRDNWRELLARYRPLLGLER